MQVDTAPAPRQDYPLKGVRPRWSDLSLIALIAGSVQMILFWGQGRPLWLDEQLVAMNLRARDLGGLAGRLNDNVHLPLLWAWTEKLMSLVLGTGERSLRLLPLLFALATLVVAWWIGRTWLSPVGAVLFVAALSVSASMVLYAMSLKAYTADTFFVLLLVGLAARAADRPAETRRLHQWWGVAIVASWFSMASIYVAAALALVLFLQRIRLGWRALAIGAIGGVAWVASFAFHYLIVLRHTLGDDYLTNIWAGIGYPDRNSRPGQVLDWTYEHLAVLAGNPIWVGRAAPYLLWSVIGLGVLAAALRRPTYGGLLAAPVLIGFVLAWLWLVPLTGRLSLWLVPVVLLAATVAVDGAVRAALALWRGVRERGRTPVATDADPQDSTGSAYSAVPGDGTVPVAGLRPRLRPTVAGAVALSVVAASAVVLSGAALVAAQVDTRTVHNPPAMLEDDRAVEFMIANFRPGDVALFLAGARRAAHWYDEKRRLNPARVIVNAPTGAACDPASLGVDTRPYQRALVYVGVLYAPYHGARPVVERRFSEVGRIVETREFGLGVVYIVDLRARPEPLPAPQDGGTKSDCVKVMAP